MSKLMDTLKRIDGNLLFALGEGRHLLASNGQRYLDLYGDNGVVSLGYGTSEQQRVLEGLADGDVALHIPLAYGNLGREIAAARLCDLTEMHKVFFCTSGSEAVEAAIKCARKTQWDRGEADRVDIYGWVNAFHGRTYGALAAGDGPSYHHRGFGPLPSGFKRFRHIEDIRPDAAAVIIAPVFGNYDLIVYEDDWLRDLASYCRFNGILLIFDEIQTGMGRVGAPTRAQLAQIEPDIICLAKGMAMGVACGAMLARGDAATAFTPGSHFNTFGGQPLISMFINGMIDWLTIPGNLQQVELAGGELGRGLKNFPWAKNARGIGLMVGFDVEFDKVEFGRECLEENLLVVGFRPGPGPVKLTPPLTITDEEIEFALEGLDKAARRMS